MTHVRHLGSRMRRIGLGPAEKKVGSGSSHRSGSHCCSSQLGLKLCSSWYLLNRAPFFGGKITPKIKLLLLLQSGGVIKKTWIFMFFLFYSYMKNDSIWVERRRITVGNEQKSKANNNHFDGKTRSIIKCKYRIVLNNDEKKQNSIIECNYTIVLNNDDEKVALNYQYMSSSCRHNYM